MLIDERQVWPSASEDDTTPVVSTPLFSLIMSVSVMLTRLYLVLLYNLIRKLDQEALWVNDWVKISVPAIEQHFIKFFKKYTLKKIYQWLSDCSVYFVDL